MTDYRRFTVTGETPVDEWTMIILAALDEGASLRVNPADREWVGSKVVEALPPPPKPGRFMDPGLIGDPDMPSGTVQVGPPRRPTNEHPEMRHNMDDFTELWMFGPLEPLLGPSGGGGFSIGGEPATGRVHVGGNIRTDTFDPPLPDDISDADLRAALLGRAEQALAVIEAAGWHLVNPRLTLEWGEAARWINQDDPGGPNAWILRPGLDRITCELATHLERA